MDNRMHGLCFWGDLRVHSSQIPEMEIAANERCKRRARKIP